MHLGCSSYNQRADDKARWRLRPSWLDASLAPSHIISSTCMPIGLHSWPVAVQYHPLVIINQKMKTFEDDDCTVTALRGWLRNNIIQGFTITMHYKWHNPEPWTDFFFLFFWDLCLSWFLCFVKLLELDLSCKMRGLHGQCQREKNQACLSWVETFCINSCHC